jgi:hypothetical protein
MIAKGVKGNHERRSFKTWVEGVVPSCIIEVTSEETAREDLKQKKPTYQKIGVREYFLFDPLEDYLPHQLMGFRLTAKKYQRIKPDADGSLFCKELGLRLFAEGTKLRLVDCMTGKRVPTWNELHEAAENAQQKIEADRRRIAELEAELARVKRTRNGHHR